MVDSQFADASAQLRRDILIIQTHQEEPMGLPYQIARLCFESLYLTEQATA
jgi:hypothetical protein